MRRLLALISALCLFAALANGAMVHAAEAAGAGEVTAATEWLHVDGDHDEVPADADNSGPHHHNVCHGHDLAAPVKGCGAPTAPVGEATPPAAPGLVLAGGPPARTLRPPIA